ncbi:preprotein translocase subunit SecG [Aureliella helgolandensis]|uniref:Protein-export membrane protein SecG n=1 Tax=Aureliella helgolandensis TaxID=2527968 RepID=A0A518G249_9BACT|nr:preprotein translocase subunit SecG [Aureliella helgolandensis]QDV22671.1 preprotein translocase subunit SecG [Aureliella helgolandensis]
MLLAALAQYFFGITIFVSSLFLVMLVLVQRGRGGGLTGALGGPGGQSAFGTKAGDLFTRITIGVAVVWISLCVGAVYFLKDRALPSTGLNDSEVINSSDLGSTPPAAGGATEPPPVSGSTPPPAAETPEVETAAPAASTTSESQPADGEAAPETPAQP